MLYKDIPFSLDEIAPLEGTVTGECWRYLSGKYCKRVSDNRNDNERVRDIYDELGAIFGYTRTSLKKVVTYAGAIDRIHRLLPDVAHELLNGEVKISAEDTNTLSKLKFHEINDVVLRRKTEKTMTKKLISEQKALRKMPEKRGRPRRAASEVHCISIKDVPAHDPDARINALVYTIPSWIGMTERVFDDTELERVSESARNRLVGELNKLTAAAETLVAILTEVDS
jgi:hypothetical protein